VVERSITIYSTATSRGASRTFAKRSAALKIGGVDNSASPTGEPIGDLHPHALEDLCLITTELGGCGGRSASSASPAAIPR
jgi:hypothetical protein